MVAPLGFIPGNQATKPYFVLLAARGITLVEQFRVTNTGTVAGTARLYAVDATTGQTSGLVYPGPSDLRHDVGAWIHLSTTSVTLAANQSQVVSFQLHVPATARGGDHVGGIVAENTRHDTVVQSTKIQISAERRTVMAVQLNLGEPLIEQLAATDVGIGGANSSQTVLLGLRNTGTVMLHPYGTIQVFDATNQLRVNSLLQLDTFLPQTAIHYPVYVQHKALGIGTYRADLQLRYGKDGAVSLRTTFAITAQQIQHIFGNAALAAPPAGKDFVASPSLWYLAVALLLLAGVGGIVLRKRGTGAKSRLEAIPSKRT